MYNKEAQKRYAQKYPERRKKVFDNWLKKNRAHFNELMRRAYWRNKEKIQIRYEGRKVVMPERILCQICKENKAVERHHPDYNLPKYVLFVCKKCHERI
jgi:hypothetical protein